MGTRISLAWAEISSVGCCVRGRNSAGRMYLTRGHDAEDRATATRTPTPGASSPAPISAGAFRMMVVRALVWARCSCGAVKSCASRSANDVVGDEVADVGRWQDADADHDGVAEHAGRCCCGADVVVELVPVVAVAGETVGEAVCGFTPHIWAIEPVASMTADDAVAAIGPNLQRYISGTLTG
ncbi:hypothetical protein [Rhodococcus erythropolis]|uniref:hypothetical protein n=1 Tax=Rhodococcus erythropolis TaxID=1833 RepID=UPI0039C23765